jgi:hypothetical protein
MTTTSYLSHVTVERQFIRQDPMSLKFFIKLERIILIILPVNDQLNVPLFFLTCLFQFSTCFEQPRAHHQENQL